MSDTLTTLVAVSVLSIVPLLLVASTSFVKLALVFSILRSALGAADLPSGLVITALSAILSFYVMSPVFTEMARAGAPAAAAIDLDAPLAGDSRSAVLATIDKAKEPLRRFLERNAGEAERDLFVRLSRQRAGDEDDAAERGDLMVVLPAFLVTELKEGFQLGFFVLLPFVVIDLVVSNILLALGMVMLPPATVALPFKLLLFVLVDGFYVLSEALVSSYA